jgi:ribosome-binding protein aMBF1 (putative translation factor)
VDPLTEAVDATLAKMSADADSADALGRRRRAIWAMRHEQQMTVTAIGRALREALLARGLSEEQLAGAGLTVHTIRSIVEGPRPG